MRGKPFVILKKFFKGEEGQSRAVSTTPYLLLQLYTPDMLNFETKSRVVAPQVIENKN